MFFLLVFSGMQLTICIKIFLQNFSKTKNTSPLGRRPSATAQRRLLVYDHSANQFAAFA